MTSTHTEPAPMEVNGARAGEATVRLTTAQAIVRFLGRQHSVRDGRRQRLVPAMLGRPTKP